ncbi:MAG: glycosyltransferase, partial [Alphaproteobacteria bacterium]|nr:glycosyltransferase [Alphaproteobacteria bacterium]
LDSVVNQTLKEIEIICVNDGSTDSSLEILKEYAQKENRIIIINQENQGLSCSRNNALKIANGKYIVFLDSDDYISNDALDKIYRSMEYSNLDMLSYSGINFDDNTKEKQINNYWEFSYLPNNFNFHKFSFNECKNFAHRMAVSSCLTAYRFLFLKQNNIEFPAHLFFEDNFFFTKALLNAQYCGIIKDKLYFRRIHKNQITQNWENKFSDYLKIVDLTLTYLTSKKIEKNIFQRYAKKYIDVIQWQYNKFSLEGKAKYKQEIDDLIKKHQVITTKKLNPIKPYILFPVYLIKTARMKKKIHKKVCRIIREQLSRQFENTLLLTKPQIRDFALKNAPTPDYVKKNIKKIANDIYDKFHFRKKHRILGIKFYTKNKHKELSSLLTYSIKQNELIKKENTILKNQIEETKKENSVLKSQIEETKKELQKTIQ